NWSQWFIGFAPLGILLLVLVPLLSYLVCRPQIKESPEIAAWAANELRLMGPLSRNERIMLGLILLAMFLWITGSNPNITLPVLRPRQHLHAVDDGRVRRGLAAAGDRGHRIRRHRRREERVGGVVLLHIAADAGLGSERDRLHQMGGGGLRCTAEIDVTNDGP